MVQTEKIAAVLHTLLAFGALWILISCFWRSHRLDALRDRLFDLRHELFAMAERKEIAFEHPAYSMLRVQFNRMLARAHRITGLMLLVRAPQRIENPRQRWLESLTTLPAETQQKLMNIEERMGVAVVWHLIVGSPITILILLYQIIEMFLKRKGNPPEQTHRLIADEVARSMEALDRIPEDEHAMAAG